MKEYRMRGYAMVEVSKIVVVKGFNPRHQFEREKIDELKQSILAVGIKTPLIIQENGDDTFNLRDGERRIIAITELISEGHPFHAVPCRIMSQKADAAEALLEAITANTGVPLNKGEEARAFHRFVHVYGWTVPKLAEMLGKPLSSVYQRVQLWEESDNSVREALLAGEVGVYDAIVINKEGNSADTTEEVKQRVVKNQKEKKQFCLDVWNVLNEMVTMIGEDKLTPEQLSVLDKLLKKFKPVTRKAKQEQVEAVDPVNDIEEENYFQEPNEEDTL